MTASALVVAQAALIEKLVDTLIDAPRHGVDVDARIAVLATFLGHVNPANTYWYLTASPELMALVTERMTAHQHRSRP